jgi:hypothetical protein
MCILLGLLYESIRIFTFNVEVPYITYEIVQVGEDSYVVLWSRQRTVRYVGITVLNDHAAFFFHGRPYQ